MLQPSTRSVNQVSNEEISSRIERVAHNLSLDTQWKFLKAWLVLTDLLMIGSAFFSLSVQFYVSKGICDLGLSSTHVLKTG